LLVKQRTSSVSAIQYIPYDQAYEPGFEDMARRVPSLEKLVRLTNFRPSMPLPVIVDKVSAHIAARTPVVQTAPSQ
jgi:UDP-glucose 4-epimerase